MTIELVRPTTVRTSVELGVSWAFPNSPTTTHTVADRAEQQQMLRDIYHSRGVMGEAVTITHTTGPAGSATAVVPDPKVRDDVARALVEESFTLLAEGEADEYETADRIRGLAPTLLDEDQVQRARAAGVHVLEECTRLEWVAWWVELAADGQHVDPDVVEAAQSRIVEVLAGVVEHGQDGPCSYCPAAHKASEQAFLRVVAGGSR
jgi:hypothetical protein